MERTKFGVPGWVSGDARPCWQVRGKNSGAATRLPVPGRPLMKVPLVVPDAHTILDRRGAVVDVHAVRYFTVPRVAVLLGVPS